MPPSWSTTEFFRDAKATVVRFLVRFVAFCQLFRTGGGRISTEANKANEEFDQGEEAERRSIGRGISDYVGLIPSRHCPHALGRVGRAAADRVRDLVNGCVAVVKEIIETPAMETVRIRSPVAPPARSDLVRRFVSR